MNNEISSTQASGTDTASEIGTSQAYQETEATTTMTTMTSTTETTTTPATTKTPRAKKAPKIATPYPFETKAQIARRIATDNQYVLRSLVTLWERQTQHEQETKTTEVRNRIGFMSSHAVTGCKLAEKLVAGEGLTPEEFDKAQGIVSRYTRQLAVLAREEALAANPELAATAAIFGV